MNQNHGYNLSKLFDLESQKGIFSYLVFRKITQKIWFFTNYEQITKRPWVPLHLGALLK